MEIAWNHLRATRFLFILPESTRNASSGIAAVNKYPYQFKAIAMPGRCRLLLTSWHFICFLSFPRTSSAERIHWLEAERLVSAHGTDEAFHENIADRRLCRLQIAPSL